MNVFEERERYARELGKKYRDNYDKKYLTEYVFSNKFKKIYNGNCNKLRDHSYEEDLLYVKNYLNIEE